MGSNVFANKRAICHQGSSGKSVAAMADVCLSPPPPPAGPLPVPYPNTGLASDLKDGSKRSFINGKPICLSDKSCFSKSSGDEGGTQGGGVLSHKTRGKVYFSSWSMDVKVEGEGVCRHLDLTMHNAASFPRNTATWPYLDSAQVSTGGTVASGPCKGVDQKFMLVSYTKSTKDSAKTGHHLIPDRCCQGIGNGEYSHGSAPTIMVEGINQHTKEHALCHQPFDTHEAFHHKQGKPLTYAAAREVAAGSARGANNETNLSPQELECIKVQLDNYYKSRCEFSDDTQLNTSGYRGKQIPQSMKDTIEELGMSEPTLMKKMGFS